MQPDISIIICTYSPDLRILRRCLISISALVREDLQVECFLVDNNSPEPIVNFDIVQSFLHQCPWAKLLIEKEQGLTHARLCGFRKSTAPHIVFFDDDNEPDKNYLIGIRDYVKRRPYIGAFGPSIIKVDYLDPVDPWISQRKYYFQETAIWEEDYALTTAGYQACYPFGSGLVIKREVLEEYSLQVNEGRLSATDRKGKSLASGGDVQIVWTSIKMGFGAGRTPLLKLVHMIQASKANMNYLKRLSYGRSVSYVTTRLEMFPEEIPNARAKILSSTKATLLCFKILVFNFFSRDVGMKLGQQIGFIHGYCHVFGKKNPVVTNWMKRWLKLG